jgi:glycosyltransferase involved in cell wall biosynthesis
VSDVGSLGEIVREYKTGEVVPPGDPQALAKACARLLQPKRLATAYEGAQRAAQELTWERAAAAHDELYRAVRR